MLKDFWLPALLAIAGIAAGFAAAAAEGNARRLWLTIMGAMFFISWISQIWGDPVRGPFYGATHPHAQGTFNFHFGTNRLAYPVKALSEGVYFWPVGNSPILLKISKTWWSGRKYDLSLRWEGEKIIEVVKNNKIELNGVPSGMDVDANFDDQSIEVVRLMNPVSSPSVVGKGEWMPIVQVVWDGDYDVHVNAMYTELPDTAVFLNEAGMIRKSRLAIKRSDFPRRLFKYPSYANRGVRE